jgi:hypothetical protein
MAKRMDLPFGNNENGWTVEGRKRMDPNGSMEKWMDPFWKTENGWM